MSSHEDHRIHKTSDEFWRSVDRTTQIAQRLSIIGAVIAGLYGFYESRERAEAAAEAARLQSLSCIEKLIDEDFKVQQSITNFDYSKLPDLENAARTSRTAQSLYFGGGLGDVATIALHYERMGAQLKDNYLDSTTTGISPPTRRHSDFAVERS